MEWQRVLAYIAIIALIAYGIVGFPIISNLLYGAYEPNGYDDGWHAGIKQCSEYWNLSSEEMMLVNEHRASLAACNRSGFYFMPCRGEI